MAGDQNWMLDEVTGVRGVRHAVVLSADGLVRAQSAHTSRMMPNGWRRHAPGSSRSGRAWPGSSGSAASALVR
jgi:hypothetical protein